MKITNRDKKLLRFWPALWPIFFFLLFRRHKDSDWWDWFLVGVSLLVAIWAVGIGAYAAWKFINRPRPKPTFRPGSRVGAFTLIELLTVIAIIGLLAALVAPSVINMMKGDAGVAATRQMLDDCARARQLAIANRSTVYMVFVPTNFWNDPLRASGGNQWTLFQSTCPNIASGSTVTQIYGAQLNGYAIYSLQSVGDQPGAHHPKDLLRVKTLPPHSFFAPIKFIYPQYSYNPTNPTPPFLIWTNFPMYGFLCTNTIPFPTVDALTNSAYAGAVSLPGRAFPMVPYIAFNSVGQLTRGDGELLPYDEYIPMAYGDFTPATGQTTPRYIENPPGNSTNISFNLIHIDRMTGRARIERTEVN